MALSLTDCAEIVRAQRETGLTYMMMETSVFAREFFAARELVRTDALGEPTFFRGTHIQNLDGFPRYWMGYPPMAYLTHALSPALALTGASVTDVHCLGLGSGSLEPWQRWGLRQPVPGRDGCFRLDRGGLAAEITMSFFQTARLYQEGFSVYGTKMSLEWPAVEGDPLLEFSLASPEPGRRGRAVDVRRVEAPDRPDLLPPEIAAFTRRSQYTPPGGLDPILLGGHHRGFPPAPRPRVRPQHRRAAPACGRRPDRGGVDRARSLRARVGDGGRRSGRGPPVRLLTWLGGQH